MPTKTTDINNYHNMLLFNIIINSKSFSLILIIIIRYYKNIIHNVHSVIKIN